jgi:hypothetical protein
MQILLNFVLSKNAAFLDFQESAISYDQIFHTECNKHQHTQIQEVYSYLTGEIDYSTTLPKCR